MPYDELLVVRIRACLGYLPELVEKKMFGGVGFMLNGNMTCGVHKNYLIVRVGSDQYKKALQRPHTRPFDLTGRPMTGWVMVEPAGCASEKELSAWLEQGLTFARTLPGK
jgi:TfoX/Sxy family transcriptional regulator of competence genes